MTAFLLAPAAAQAACVAGETNPFTQVEHADVAFVGLSQDGENQDGLLLSPVPFAVEYRLDAGDATSEGVVGGSSRGSDGTVISDSEGLSFERDQRWLIVGDRRDDGNVSPGCGETSRQVDPSSPPMLRIGQAKVRGEWSDTRARLFTGRRPRALRLTKAGLTARDVTAARLVRGNRRISLTRKSGAWSLARAQGGDRLVVADSNGFWAVRLTK